MSYINLTIQEKEEEGEKTEEKRGGVKRVEMIQYKIEEKMQG